MASIMSENAPSETNTSKTDGSPSKEEEEKGKSVIGDSVIVIDDDQEEEDVIDDEQLDEFTEMVNQLGDFPVRSE